MNDDLNKLAKQTNISNLEYKGGHPRLTKEKSCTLRLDGYMIQISCGFNYATIDYSKILGIHFESIDQISRRITATRLVLLGPFALVFKKKKVDNTKYLTIDFIHNKVESTCIIGGKNVLKAYSVLNEKYGDYLKRNPKKETIQKVEVVSNNDIKINPYEEIKQAKELLDMGIITQEEFDAKKKKLLKI